MKRRCRLRYSDRFRLRYCRLWFRLRLFHLLTNRLFRLAIHTTRRLLIQSLLEPGDPAATLFLFRDRLANRRLRHDGFGRLTLFRLFEVDDYFFRRRTNSTSVGESIDRFGYSSAFRPIDRIKPKIVALVRIGAGLNELLNNVRVTEDYSEDERRLAAARTFVYVSAAGY